MSAEWLPDRNDQVLKLGVIMRELDVKELEAVNGGFAWVIAGALANGAYSAFNACIQGGNVTRAFLVGTASGALMGTGLGLLGNGIKVGANTLKSVTAGVTALGAGGAVNTLQE